jgi:tetratricopeptide (TPR) repeat protein
MSQVQDEGLEGQALEVLASSLRQLGFLPEARDRLKQALDKAQHAGLRGLEEAVYNGLALVARSLHEFDEAERLFMKSLEISAELGDAIATGTAKNNIGLLQHDRNDLAGARRNYEEALLLFTEAHEVFAIVNIRLNLARVEVAEGKTELADQLIAEAHEEASRIGAYGTVAAADYLSGALHEHRAHEYSPEERPKRDAEILLASKKYADSARIYRETGDDRNAAFSLEAAGFTLRQIDERDSRRYLAEASQLYKRVGMAEDAERVEAGPVLPSDTEQRELNAIEAAIEAVRSGADPSQVGVAVRAANVYTLGRPTAESAQGTESDILHFTIDLEGREKVMLPIFTRFETMREALIRNKEWQELSVLQVNGAALLDNIDEGVNVVANPWTPFEFVMEGHIGNHRHLNSTDR